MSYKKQTKFDSLAEMNKYLDLSYRHVDGVDDRSDFTTFKKNQFRKSIEWRSFVSSIISDRKCCERCGSTEKLIVHHKDPKNYSLLRKNLFVVLCSSCHLKIESFCGTEEQMKRCPNTDKKFLTLYPYTEKDNDVLSKGSGQFLVSKWRKELDNSKAPGKWTNTNPAHVLKKAEIKSAISFMKENPELFKFSN